MLSRHKIASGLFAGKPCSYRFVSYAKLVIDAAL